MSISTPARAAGCGARARRAATSLRLVDLAADCDGDALLVTVDPAGPTCHRGTRTCFDPDGAPPSARPRASPGSSRSGPRSPARAAERPDGSYTARLLDGGVDAAGRKVTEEATEVLLAAKDDAAAESTPARPARDRETPWPARPPTSCTTRWSAWPSAASAAVEPSSIDAPAQRATATVALSVQASPTRLSSPGGRSPAGASRSGPRATPRRWAPGRTPGPSHASPLIVTPPPAIIRRASPRDGTRRPPPGTPRRPAASVGRIEREPAASTRTATASTAGSAIGPLANIASESRDRLGPRGLAVRPRRDVPRERALRGPRLGCAAASASSASISSRPSSVNQRRYVPTSRSSVLSQYW